MKKNTIEEYKNGILEPIDELNTSNYKVLVDGRDTKSIKILGEAYNLYLNKLYTFTNLNTIIFF